MKRISHVWASAIIASFLLIPFCFAQSDDGVSLGEAARATRKVKQSEPAPKAVYENDNLPKEEHISVVGDATPATADSAQTSQDSQAQPDSQANNDDKSKLAIEPGQSSADRDAVYAEWRKKVADQKDTISLLQREFDVLQREYRLRAAVMYADAGNRLRNSAEWDKEDRDYKDKIAAKQKDLDRAKQQLSDMQEQARKSGVPAGIVE